MKDRAAVQEALKARGIPRPRTTPHCAASSRPFRNVTAAAREEASQLAQKASERVISLPMHPHLSAHDQDQVEASVTASHR